MDEGLKKFSVLLMVAGLIIAAAAFVPYSVQAQLSYQLLGGLHMLDVQVKVIQPVISASIVDQNGAVLSQVIVGSGGHIFAKGIVKDQSNQPVDGVTVHIYAKIANQYLSVVNGCGSGAPEPSGCELNSERTSNGGQWDTAAVSSSPVNTQEWLEARSDGLYASLPWYSASPVKVWTGSLSGQVMTLFATMWGGDGSFAGKSPTQSVQFSGGGGGSCTAPTSYAHSLNGESVNSGGSYQATSPIQFKTVPNDNPASVSKVYLEGVPNQAQIQFNKQSDGSWLSPQVTLTQGQYTLAIKADVCQNTGVTILSMSWTGNTVTIGGPSSLQIWVVFGGLALFAFGLALFVIAKRKE